MLIALLLGCVTESNWPETYAREVCERSSECEADALTTEQARDGYTIGCERGAIQFVPDMPDDVAGCLDEIAASGCPVLQDQLCR